MGSSATNKTLLDFDGHQSSAYTKPIRGFIVSDNGEGFHDENIRSFRTLDSEYKAKLGGRGVGRLLWLKAFSQEGYQKLSSASFRGSPSNC